MSPHDDTLQRFEDDNNFAAPMCENTGAMNRKLRIRQRLRNARGMQWSCKESVTSDGKV